MAYDNASVQFVFEYSLQTDTIVQSPFTLYASSISMPLCTMQGLMPPSSASGTPESSPDPRPAILNSRTAIADMIRDAPADVRLQMEEVCPCPDHIMEDKQCHRDGAVCASGKWKQIAVVANWCA